MKFGLRRTRRRSKNTGDDACLRQPIPHPHTALHFPACPSEHSSANAIDISAFILADGTRIALINDWKPGDKRSEFLHEVRDGSCGLFSTVLSPDHNAAHANHFHLDMAARTAGWTVCR